MNEIFLSYASRDRAVAQQLADALEGRGWSVWWDREIPYGKPFDQVIEERLNAAACVIVLWTAESVRSRWVKTEASAAADRDRLIPVLLEDVTVPLEFRLIQTAVLHHWSGDRGDPEFVRLVDSVRQMLGEPAVPRADQTREASRRFLPFRSRMVLIGAVGVLVLLAAWGLWPGPKEQSSGAPSATTADASKKQVPAPQADRSSEIQASGAPQTRSGADKTASTGPFAIRIGDVIDDGVPQPGAGAIDTPGEKDVYTFNAVARQRVYFRKLKHGRGMELVEWTLADPDGRMVFESRLGYSEPGVQVLRKPGTYSMTIGSSGVPATGTYQLRLFDVPPPQHFSIRIGDTISENASAAGAGVIESPGAKDVYAFTATPGQRVYFRKLDHARGMELIEWRVTDADGTQVFDSRLGYGDPGVQVLHKGGTYTLEVGSDRDPATGNYRLQLTNAPA